jgi:hypothetical protein
LALAYGLAKTTILTFPAAAWALYELELRLALQLGFGLELIQFLENMQAI